MSSLFDNLAVGPHSARRGIDDQETLVAVHEDLVTRRKPTRNVMHSDHCRNLHRSRHDRTVRCGTAQVGSQTDYFVLWQSGCFGGRKVVGNNDGARRDIMNCNGAGAREIARNPSSHVLDVGHSLSQVVILKAREYGHVLVGNDPQRCFGILVLRLNLLQDLFNKDAIIENGEVDIKHAHLAVPHARTDVALDLFDLAPRIDQRIFQPRNLTGNLTV